MGQENDIPPSKKQKSDVVKGQEVEGIVKPDELCNQDIACEVRQDEDISNSITPAKTSTLKTRDRVCLYTEAFEETLDGVLESESFLFTKHELSIINEWKKLARESKYLYVRLFLRKPAWFRVSEIPYQDEISNPFQTCASLSRKLTDIPNHHDSNDQEGYCMNSQFSTLEKYLNAHDLDLAINNDMESQSSSRFALDADVLRKTGDIEQMLSMLTVEKLKVLASKLKIHQAGNTRESITKALKRSTSNQSTLHGSFYNGSCHIGLHFDAKGNKRVQTSRVMEFVLAMLGPCIKLSPQCVSIFSRVCVIYHRTDFLEEHALVSSLLARMKIRNYPTYQVKRSFSPFSSRSQLLSYDQALRSERTMLEFLGDMEPGLATRSRPLQKEERIKLGLELFELVYPLWKQIVDEQNSLESSTVILLDDTDEDSNTQSYYRMRFHPGWPFTRVVYKGCALLARQRQFHREKEVLEQLLQQMHFRRGKRGAWYDRLALILMTHFEENKKQRRREALDVCIRGLEDSFTHLIYHDALRRRIVRLENSLEVKKKLRHDFSQTQLRKANNKILYGERLSEKIIGQKSIWRSLDGAEITVEQLVLEWYERKGWKGFHSESGIITTIFSLLFYDVLFAPIDGVFETPYQNSPLDLGTDAFAISRSEQIYDHLQRIEKGEAADILEAVDDRERAKNTWVVGVRWNMYSKTDLLEIINCIGGRAISIICKALAEEWGHRVGGFPDLCVWNWPQRTCKFIEVKGPGDTLSETQKVWIDLLLYAGADVEVCRVVESTDIYVDDD